MFSFMSCSNLVGWFRWGILLTKSFINLKTTGVKGHVWMGVCSLILAPADMGFETFDLKSLPQFPYLSNRASDND